MSTAGRPTFNSAIGGANQGGFRMFASSKAYSSKDIPGHTKLKVRQPGQGTQAEVKQRDLKGELEERETKHFVDSKRKEDRLLLRDEEEDEEVKLIENKGVDDGEDKLDKLLPANIDADDSDSSEEEKSDEDEEEDEDDEAELMKELERIQKEREEQAKKEEAQRTKDKEYQTLHSNPLLNRDQPQDFTVKKRWYDDTIFKNQARTESKQQKRFINDTIRNDFHRKFLNKYVQ